MVNILYSARDDQFDGYARLVTKGLKSHNITARVAMDIPAAEADYVIYAPNSPLQNFAPFERCKLVQSLWAGVERIVGNDTLTQPLTRMVDPGMSEGMVNWVAGHALRHLLDMDRMTHNPTHEWDDTFPPLASDRHVVVLGLGALGSAVALALKHLGFRVSGWSRRPKQLEGITCLSGPQGFEQGLRTAHMVVLLLPDTPATENIINAKSLNWMPKGAVILNPGRGPLIDDDALLASLNSGHLGAATLDVFRQEPLPKDHPFWGHPKITVTPHVASSTRLTTATQVVVENIRRAEAGEDLMYLVDRKAGY